MFTGSLSSLYRTTCPYKKFGETKLKFPFGVCCNEDGDVFVSDWEAGLIYQVYSSVTLKGFPFFGGVNTIISVSQNIIWCQIL